MILRKNEKNDQFKANRNEERKTDRRREGGGREGETQHAKYI